MVERRLLRVVEFAQLLGVGRSTAYLILKSGEIPVIRIGRSVRVDYADAVRWIDEQRDDGKSA